MTVLCLGMVCEAFVIQIWVFHFGKASAPPPPNVNVAGWNSRSVTKRDLKVTTLKFKRGASFACGMSVGSIILPSVRSIELVDDFLISLYACE